MPVYTLFLIFKENTFFKFKIQFCLQHPLYLLQPFLFSWHNMPPLIFNTPMIACYATKTGLIGRDTNFKKLTSQKYQFVYSQLEAWYY